MFKGSYSGTRFLCVCQYGHSRSAALARVLHSLEHEAVAAGWMTSPSLVRQLAKSDAFDVVVAMDATAAAELAKLGVACVLPYDVGPDVWSNPYHPELERVIRERLVPNLIKE